MKHFLEVLDELNQLKMEFISFREQIDTGAPLGRAVVVIIGAIAEPTRNLIMTEPPPRSNPATEFSAS